jgi:hypothetical protein
MPKSVLEFHIPDEAYEFYSAVHGGEFRSALWELDNQLRGWLKYGHDFKDANEALTAVRNTLFDLTDKLDLE